MNGVTCFAEKDDGLFAIRLGGTHTFVSKIDPDDPRCVPPGSVDLVEGRNNPDILTFDDLDETMKAAAQVFEIEGFHVRVEPIRTDHCRCRQ